MSAVLSSSPEIDCREAEPRLHMLLDGELAPEEHEAVQAHLENCGGCRRELSLLEKTRAALADNAAVERAPDALVSRIGGDVSRLARRDRRSRLLWAAPAALAAVALVVAGFSLFTARDAAPAAAPDVFRQLLDAHTLDVPVDVATPDPRRVEEFLAPRIGARVRVPTLDRAGLSLAGARVVSAADRRAGQLVYEDGLGARVTLLVVPDERGLLSPTQKPADAMLAGFVEGAPPPAATRRDGAHAVRLVHDGHALFALIGALDGERMDRIARTLAPGTKAARVAER